ncbi:hypothetical protein [Bacillus sp. MRMR6]|uniref:hypothetical protein n=1 Tax=Bacillus sp. MRMR6 TaxID=1928617 RepID=UPI00095146C5|nr:hypothetical protein [Bacillus sp. MRMR6]OLS37715.1 hypothetical protein BTR25_15475 [Bacillus sp. MRMR6]
MGRKQVYTDSELRIALYNAKIKNPGKKLTPYNLAKLTEYPIQVWQRKMREQIDIINDSSFSDEIGLLQSSNGDSIPLVNYYSEFKKLIEKEDTQGVLNLARELSITHTKLFSDKYTGFSLADDLQKKENEIEKLTLEINELKEKISNDKRKYVADIEKWKRKYKALSIRALKNIQNKENTVVPFSPFKEKKLGDTNVFEMTIKATDEDNE